MSRQEIRVVRSTEVATEDVAVNVPGNHYDKHGSQNPLIRRMMAAFHDGVVDLVDSVHPKTILDVGCGEGLTTGILGDRLSPGLIIGCDLELSAVALGPSNSPEASFLAASAYGLPFENNSFDVVVATEVLEHLDSPHAALGELARVAERAVVLTVPNEPWWRVGNVARGKYLTDLGNTPGHVQHWSTSSFRRFLETAFQDIDVKRVAMWNQAIVRL